METPQPTSALDTLTYEISSIISSEPNAYLSLQVNKATRSITGESKLIFLTRETQLTSEVSGKYAIETISPQKTITIIELTGSPQYQTAGIHNPDIKLILILNEDWKSGTAKYKYLYQGKWYQTEGIVKIGITETIS